MRWAGPDCGGLAFIRMELRLRSALVIEKKESLRRQIVQFLKNRGWIVHGVSRVEQAIPVLPSIPYQLIVIDSELLKPTYNAFTRALHKTKPWRMIPPVVLTDTEGLDCDPILPKLGAIVARRSAWKNELSEILLASEKAENKEIVSVVPVSKVAVARTSVRAIGA